MDSLDEQQDEGDKEAADGLQSNYPRYAEQRSVSWKIRLARGFIIANLWCSPFLIIIIVGLFQRLHTRVTIEEARSIAKFEYFAMAMFPLAFIVGMCSNKRNAPNVWLAAVGAVAPGFVVASIVNAIGVYRYHSQIPMTIILSLVLAYTVSSLFISVYLRGELRNPNSMPPNS